MDQNAAQYLASIGASQDQIRRSLTRYTAPAQSAPAQTNSWANWLPTIGSVAAPVIGAALAPETGGLSLLAGAALSGAGSAAGKGAQNLVQGNDFGSGMGTSFGEGALGGAVGGLAGKAVGALGSKLVGGLADTAGNVADKQAAQATYDRLSPFKGVDASTLEKNKLLDTSNLFQKLGLQTNPEEFTNAANAVTGENGAVNGIKNQLIQQAGPVNVGGFMDTVNGALDKGTLLTDSAKKNIQSILRHELDNTVLEGNGTLTNTANPTSVFDAIKNIRSSQFALKGTDPAVQQQRQILQAAADHLQNALGSGSGVNKLVSDYRVGPQDFAAISNATGGHPGLTSHIVDGLNNAKSVKDLQAIEAPFVNAGSLAKAARTAEQGAIPNPSANAAVDPTTAAILNASTPRGLLGMVPKIAKAVTGGDAGVTAANNAVQGATGAFDGLPDGLKALLGGAAQVPVQAATHSSDFSSPQAALPGGPSDTSALNAVPSDPSQAFTSPTQTPASGFTDEQLQQALAQDMQTGGQHASTIMQMIQLNAAGAKAAAGSPAAMKTASDIQDAFSGLNTAAAQLQSIGGAQGPAAAMAKIPVVGQFLNPDVAAYNSTRIDVATALAKALTGSARPAASVINQYVKSLPESTDTPQVAAKKMSLIQMQLSNRASAHGLDPTTGASLQ